MIRLLLALTVAFAAMLLTFGWAGSVQAHDGAHEMRIALAGDVPADPLSKHHQPCHCQGTMICVQGVEAAQPLLLTLDKLMRAVGLTFEPRHEPSQSVLTDPPPPRV